MARIYEGSTKQKAGSKYPTCNLNMDDFQKQVAFSGAFAASFRGVYIAIYNFLLNQVVCYLATWNALKH